MKPFILRKAESNISPKLVEYLQSGIIIRFDIKEAIRLNDEKTTVFEYKEFWFDIGTNNIEEVVKANGYLLTSDHKILIQ